MLTDVFLSLRECYKSKKCLFILHHRIFSMEKCAIFDKFEQLNITRRIFYGPRIFWVTPKSFFESGFICSTRRLLRFFNTTLSCWATRKTLTPPPETLGFWGGVRLLTSVSTLSALPWYPYWLFAKSNFFTFSNPLEFLYWVSLLKGLDLGSSKKSNKKTIFYIFYQLNPKN